MEQKEKEARELLDQLYAKLDGEGHNFSEEGMFSLLSWLLDGSEKPVID